MNTTTEKMEEILTELLTEISYMDKEDRDESGLNTEELEDAHITTFEEAMLLTGDNGIVIHMSNGSEFQLTIIKSK